MLYLELGRPLDAARHFATCLRLKPGAAAHFNLGTALLSAGQTGDAIQDTRKRSASIRVSLPPTTTSVTRWPIRAGLTMRSSTIAR